MADKIIRSNYPSIQHLPYSKLTDPKDSNLNEREVGWLTVKTREPTDVVIVTEKVDGCNVGVLRRGDVLCPVVRKGYSVLSAPYPWLQKFADFVKERRERFISLLADGERVCGEWMIQTHTISYVMEHEPFICYDIIKDNDRVPYLDARQRLIDNGFTCAGLVHYGTAIPTDVAIRLLGDGFHGAVGQPEGVVYRYESREGGWLFNGKFVSNPLVGDQDLFKRNTVNGVRNKWKRGSFEW